eukprot:gene11984-5385_t
MKILFIFCCALFVGTFASQITLSGGSGSGGGGGGGGHTKDPSQMNSTELDAWCRDVSHNTIYNLGSKLQCPENWQTFNAAICLAVFLILILEFGIHRLHKVLKNSFYKEIMHKLTQELMLLGLISFSVNLFESVGLFELFFSAFRESPNVVETPHEITLRRVMMFEVVHIAIFFLSIFYVCVCLLSFWFAQWIWKKWSKFESMDHEMVIQNYLKYQSVWSKFSVFQKLSGSFRLTSNFDSLGYICARQRFIMMNNLNSDFRFDLYLRKQLQHLFIEMIEIQWQTWIIAFPMALISFIVRNNVIISSGVTSLITFFSLVSFIPATISGVICIYNRISFSAYESKISYKFRANYASFDLNRIQREDLIDPTLSIDIKKYHFVQSAYITFLLIQITLFVQCFSLAMIVMNYGYRIIFEQLISEYLIIKIIALILVLLPSILTALVFYPLTLSPYCCLLSLENKSHIKCALSVENEPKEEQKISKTNQGDIFTSDSDEDESDTIQDDYVML